MNRFAVILAITACCLVPHVAHAADAGADDASTDDASDGIPLACDGALCDTTNGATCDVSRVVGQHTSGGWFIIIAVAMMILKRRRSLATVGLLLGATGVAHAAPPGPVDVVMHDPPPPRRYVSVAWNPVPVVIGKASFDVVIAPLEHHAIVLSPFYASATTSPIVLQDASGNPVARLPEQTFSGFGGEIGYRYYTGLGGLRGLFAGPSFIIGSFTANAQDGTQTPYLNYGGAVDVGYQMLVADRVALALGAGLQYTFPDKTIPNQQFPANVYANSGVRPRLLFSIGCAF